MTNYIYELPTTGAISFSTFTLDSTDENAYTARIAEATQARANMRAVLKQSRRTDTELRDYLQIIKLIDDYIPHLRGIIACAQSDELHIKSDPVFSWRTTLSATLFNNSPRLRLPSLQADLASSLVTYAMALSNFSHSVITSLGAYEFERAISEKERKDKDEKLNFGVTLLCRASGVFSMTSEVILGELDSIGDGGWVRPPDLSKEVNAALAKMALADAQSLAIRKLLSKAASESALSPGPPLPRSHPSTALLAKLHLDCAALYSSARTLAMASSKPSLASGLKASFGSTSKSQNDGGGGGSVEVSADLLKYLEKESKFHSAIAHKWLGVDAGETSIPGKGGEAVGFLKWAQQELEDLHTPRLSKGLGIGRDGPKDREQDCKRQDRKTRTEKELKSVKVFLEHYRKINDSLTFDPVPKQSELQTLIPEGRMAVSTKPFTLPDPAFGPGSKGYRVRTRTRNRIQDEALGIEALRIDSQVDRSNHDTIGDESSEDESNTEGTSTTTHTYVGAGSYF